MSVINTGIRFKNAIFEIYNPYQNLSKDFEKKLIMQHLTSPMRIKNRYMKLSRFVFHIFSEGIIILKRIIKTSFLKFRLFLREVQPWCILGGLRFPRYDFLNLNGVFGKQDNLVLHKKRLRNGGNTGHKPVPAPAALWLRSATGMQPRPRSGAEWLAAAGS